MAEEIKSLDDIPDAPYYVTMVDTFLSGWGGADNRRATFVYPASSMEEAEVVEDNALNRGDQAYVRINTRKPDLDLSLNRVEVVTEDKAPRWFSKGGFHKSEHKYKMPHELSGGKLSAIEKAERRFQRENV